ncbi:MAG: multicopper oxidase family protein [Gammaproteobacteria bacterium]
MLARRKLIMLTSWVVLLYLGWTDILQASTCPTSNIINEPVQFQWTKQNDFWSGTLEFGQASFNIGSDTLTTRAYRQKDGNFGIPGPTIKMTPGQTYVLTFKNLLPYETPSAIENDLKDPNITNIHTHGLHVSGMSPADDILRLINGGYCGDYVYQVPADHMGGTLWYHPHHHGSTYQQVSGGALGLLLVDDSNDGIPSGVAAMTERQLVVQYLDPSVAGAAGDTLISGTLSSTWTVNGEVQGNLCTPVNEWQHWRVLLADSDADSKTVSVGAGCDVALLARDGVWRTVAPKDLPTNSLELTGASRADLAVKCNGDSDISINGKHVARVYADPTLPKNTMVGPYSNGATGTTWSAVRPDYLQDLRGVTSVEQRTVNMGARTLNGSKFDMDVPTFTIPTGNVQEWLVKGAGAHPFHLHVYHFQMNGTCGAFEDGEYYDTLAAAPCTMRFNLNPATSSVYDGTTIMHCHILDHEDQGAMGWVDVVGGMPPPAFPASGFQELYQCAGSLPPPPAECSSYLDRNSCNSDSACKWNGRTKICTNR